MPIDEFMARHRMSTLVETAIEANNAMRRVHQREREHMAPELFLSELCTIHLNPGRRTGKTRYIATTREMRDVVFFQHPTAIMAAVREGIREAGCFTLDDNMGWNMAAHAKEYGPPGIVYVDEPSKVFDRERDRAMFYSTLAGLKWFGRPWIIMLGA